MNDTFTLWARTTPGSFKMVHTFVTTDHHEFNCFGYPKKDGDGSEKIPPTATGSEKWVSMVYGPYEGDVDSGFACGLSIKYDGRCQSASNRVLALTREGIDARGTYGNGAVVLTDGKYGFNAKPFIDNVQKTGAQLLQTDPGEITQEDIDAAVKRITQGQSASEELDILHADVQEQFGETLPKITDDQRNKFCAIYSEYQADREAVFRSVATEVSQAVEQRLLAALVAPWSKCCDRLEAALGPNDFAVLLGVTPAKAKLVFNYA